jgi:hypothetical protein
VRRIVDEQHSRIRGQCRAEHQATGLLLRFDGDFDRENPGAGVGLNFNPAGIAVNGGIG